ncbi:hypothetical protein HDU79_000945, partial [Rhizoclosmatium sp. JEL0117]
MLSQLPSKKKFPQSEPVALFDLLVTVPSRISMQRTMQVFLLSVLAAFASSQPFPVVAPQSNPLITPQTIDFAAQLYAIRDNNPTLPKECFAGLDVIQNGNATVVSKFCADKLFSRFAYPSLSSCFYSSTSTVTTVAPVASASSVSNSKRDAGSSSTSLDLFATVSYMVTSLCMSAAAFSDPNHMPGTQVQLPNSPTLNPSPYTGDSKTLSEFITNSNLDLDLSTLIHSLVEVSLSLQSGGGQTIQAMPLNGGGVHVVVIQALVDGYRVMCKIFLMLTTYNFGQISLNANQIESQKIYSNGTIGTGTVAFSLDASITGFFLTVALSPSFVGNLLSVSVMDPKLGRLGGYIFELKNLRRKIRDAT